MTVTEPFALGHARRFPLEDVARDTQATLIRGSVSGVAPRWRSLVLENGASVDYDALLLTLGARLEAVIPKALTWTPDADPELLGGVLRDLEEGYASSVAFVIPPGVAWSLPAYELAMMTSRQVAGMDRSSIEVSVITPEHEPLADFGPHVTGTLRHELQAGHVHLRTGATLVQRGAELQLEVNGEPVRADHIVALPRPMGVLIPGLPRDENGFIPVDRHGRVRDTERVWAAGDAVSYPLKHGGLAALQADAAAESIAFVAGADIEPKPFRPTLDGVLLTGERGRRLRDTVPDGALRHRDRPRPNPELPGGWRHTCAGRPGQSSEVSHKLRGRLDRDVDPETGRMLRENPTHRFARLVPGSRARRLDPLWFPFAKPADSSHRRLPPSLLKKQR